jgi:hypothetical protein
MKTFAKALRLPLTAGLLLVLVGCEPIQSIHPFWTPETLTFEPALIGTWVSRDDPGEPDLTLRFERSDRAGEQAYRVYLYCQRPAREDKALKDWSLLLEGRLIRLDGVLYLDLYPDKVTKKNGWKMEVENPLFHRGIHTLYRVQLEGDVLKLEYLEDDWVKAQIRAGKIQVGHEFGEGHWLLTAGTHELQQLIRQAQGDALAFSAIDFRRQP